jgi:pimeloyl-ACP methyl ester carboxylesterase
MNIEQTPFIIPKAANNLHKEYRPRKKSNIEFVEEYPDKLVSETPVVFVPGMAADWEHLEDSQKILSEEGRHLFTLVHPKKKMADVDIETQKAFSILSLIENKNLDKTDLVATSEGALNALIAACLDPQKVRNIALVNPAGLYGEDGRISLAKRSGKEMARSINEATDDPEVIQKLKSLSKRSKKLMIENPSVFLQELRALSQADIREMLGYLKEQGIKVSIIQGVDDLLFPMEKTQEYAKAGLIEGFYSTKGGHYNFLTHPQDLMPLVSEALRALEEKLHIEESEEKNAWHVSNDKYGELGIVKNIGELSPHVRTFRKGKGAETEDTTQQTAKNRFRAFLPSGNRTSKNYGTLEDAANDLRRIAKKSDS